MIGEAAGTLSNSGRRNSSCSPDRNRQLLKINFEDTGTIEKLVWYNET